MLAAHTTGGSLLLGGAGVTAGLAPVAGVAANRFRGSLRRLLSSDAKAPEEDLEAKVQAVKRAQAEFKTFSQEKVDEIFKYVAHEANKARVPLAQAAVAETRLGLMEDKVIKNGVACELPLSAYANLKTCGIISRDPSTGITELATPVGPVASVLPTTNPTSTTIMKSLFALKTRNSMIFLPHPRAAQCSNMAMEVCRNAAEKAGAPKGVLQSVLNPSRSASAFVMEHPDIKFILATGGPGMVKASYSCGKPAVGVGAGNAPVLVDELADLDMAVGSIVMGKTFDNGTICASEQSTVIVDAVYDKVKSLFEKRGVYFLYGDDRKKLSDYLIVEGHINPDIVGQSAQTIAERIGVSVPSSCVVLGAEASEVGTHEPLSYEKLSPVLTLYRSPDYESGLQLAKSIAMFGGQGHTAAYYTDPRRRDRIERFAEEMPVYHQLINAPTSLGAIGSSFNFALDPSLTLGVGTDAGSSASTNVTPLHLVNVKKVAERQQHMEWFKVPKDIYFSRNCLQEAMQDAAKLYPSGLKDKRAIIVTDETMVEFGYVKKVEKTLHEAGIETHVFDSVTPDPTIECCRRGLKACEAFKPDLMIALGGGSPLDAAKMIRVMYEAPGVKLEDLSARFIELRKRTHDFPDLGSKIHRLFAIPTTSGTGSEVTPFSVITDDDGMKHPLFSYALTPDCAIIDSSYTDHLPKSLIANAGIDALVHAIESYVSVAASDYTRSLSKQAVELIFEYLPASYEHGTWHARQKVHNAATIAGMAFSNAGLGITHSMSHKVGGTFHTPHGLTNSVLMNAVIEYNCSESPTRQGYYPQYTHPQAKKHYAELARAIGCRGSTDEELVEQFKNRISELQQRLNIPATFAEAGIGEQEFLDKLEHMSVSSFDDQCTGLNPRMPLVEEIKEIYLQSYYGR